MTAFQRVAHGLRHRVGHRFSGACTVTALLLALAATPAAAQGPVDGYAAVMFDVLPDVAPANGRQTVTELRVRLFAERKDDIGRLVGREHHDSVAETVDHRRDRKSVV